MKYPIITVLHLCAALSASASAVAVPSGEGLFLIRIQRRSVTDVYHCDQRMTGNANIRNS